MCAGYIRENGIHVELFRGCNNLIILRCLIVLSMNMRKVNERAHTNLEALLHIPIPPICKLHPITSSSPYTPTDALASLLAVCRSFSAILAFLANHLVVQLCKQTCMQGVVFRATFVVHGRQGCLDSEGNSNCGFTAASKNRINTETPLRAESELR